MQIVDQLLNININNIFWWTCDHDYLTKNYKYKFLGTIFVISEGSREIWRTLLEAMEVRKEKNGFDPILKVKRSLMRAKFPLIRWDKKSAKVDTCILSLSTNRCWDFYWNNKGMLRQVHNLAKLPKFRWIQQLPSVMRNYITLKFNEILKIYIRVQWRNFSCNGKSELTPSKGISLWYEFVFFFFSKNVKKEETISSH